jgi:hypothetical protein
LFFFFFCDGPIKDAHHKRKKKIELWGVPQTNSYGSQIYFENNITTIDFEPLVWLEMKLWYSLLRISSLVVRTGPHFDGLYIIAQKRRMSATFRIKVRAQTKDDLWISLMCEGVFMSTFSMLYGYIFFDIYS